MKKQRHEAIKLYATNNKVFSIPEIADQLDVSVSTIRRDVEKLVQEGYLIKRYGSIMWNSTPMVNEFKYYEEISESFTTKEAIAKKAAELVADNDFIFIDSSSTLCNMVKYLDQRNVTVVTADLKIAIELLKKENLTVIVLGGYAWPGTYTLSGDITEKAVEQMHFLKYFTTPGAISESGDVMYYNIQTSNLRKKLRQLSMKTYVIVEKERFLKTAFITVGKLDDYDCVITDCAADEILKLCKSVEVIAVSSNGKVNPEDK